MEIEKRAPEIGNKLWNIMKILFYMIRRSKAKRSMYMLLKKGKSAGQAISNLILHHHHHHHRHHRYAALTCRPNDAATAFVSPREYEFSCRNTPLYISKRKKHHHQDEELKVMHKVLGILSRYEAAVEAAPAPVVAEEKGDDRLQVDKDAEEFIEKFYRELKKQKQPTMALESP